MKIFAVVSHLAITPESPGANGLTIKGEFSCMECVALTLWTVVGGSTAVYIAGSWGSTYAEY